MTQKLNTKKDNRWTNRINGSERLSLRGKVIMHNFKVHRGRCTNCGVSFKGDARECVVIWRMGSKIAEVREDLLAHARVICKTCSPKVCAPAEKRPTDKG